MCGRLNQFQLLSLGRKELKDARKRQRRKKNEDSKADVQGIHNICPTEYADVLTWENGEACLERMRFGLVPAWAKGSKAEVGRKFVHTFNARCETLFDMACFRGPILRQRCLIPVRGWHEWMDRSTPYFIHRSDDEPVLLAGVWDVWESHCPEDFASGPVITSMSVVTTPPGRYMAKFHDRCPLILDDENALRWLQPELKAGDIRALVQPYESEFLEAYRVSTVVNQARNKSEETVSPIAAPVPHSGDESVTRPDESAKAAIFPPPDSQLTLF